jgi:hypothetical protein
LTIRVNRTDNLGVIILFIIFIAAIIGGMVLHLQNRTMAVERKQKKQQLLSLRDQLKSLRNPDSDYRISETGNQPMPDLSLKHESQEAFIEELRRLAQAKNLQINKWDPNPNAFVMKNYPKYRITQWKVDVSGDYSGLIGFLETLPHNQQLVGLSGFEMVSIYKGLDHKSEYGYELKARLVLDLISGITPDRD